MTAAEKLAQLGVTMAEARQFIIDNIGNPRLIYDTTALHGISFAMISEIYGDPSVTGDIVKQFFQGYGYDVSGETPSTSTDDDGSDAVFSLSMNDILDLSDSDIQTSDWETLIVEYQNAINDYDWSMWGDELSQLLANFDWEAWAQELQTLANSLADDSSWISGFEDWFELAAGSDFDDTFDRSEWVWDDVDSYLDEWEMEFDDIDWDEYWGTYTDTLAALGIDADYLENLINGLFESGAFENYLDMLENYDWDAYFEQLASLVNTGNVNAGQIEPIGINVEASHDAVYLG